MIKLSIQRLKELVNIAPKLLAEISESDFAHKPLPNKWSKKEIIGHLIDSATNNHQRLVRAQFEDIPKIKYDQDKWNKYSAYQNIGGQKIIDFWCAYNNQLIEIMMQIPENDLSRKVDVGAEQPVTIEFLINDYVDHQEHHLKQVIDY